MKKKYSVTAKDKEEWIAFTENLNDIKDKEVVFSEKNRKINSVRKLDLHGYSLSDANKIVEKFVIESFNMKYKKILIVTGKGKRSKSHGNPYISDKLSVLKNSVPEFIKNNEDLSKKIAKISKANIRDGGEGAIYIYLKNKEAFKE